MNNPAASGGVSPGVMLHSPQAAGNLPEEIKIDNSFYLVGRNDSRAATRKTIEELFDGLPNKLPIMMLDHRPSEFGNVSSANVDIQVSGHTHNGQLFPLNYITSNIDDLSWGH